jgi:CarboxypepD_reg-like domain
MKSKFLLVLLCFCLFACQSSAQKTNSLSQTVKGNVLDAESKRPLASVSVFIASVNMGAITDTLGNFTMNGVSIGRQTITVSLLGYETKTIAELMVTSGKEVFITVTLTEKIKNLEEIKLISRKNKLKATNEFASVSARSFSVEETKRYAAAISDPGRMAQNFAGVSNNGDMDNSIVVRGNSPKGVLWRLEGIEIPSPNHFGGLGSTGGGISMLSSSTLGNSDFYTGAFPAEFGNALSGAFDLNFRNGNKDKKERSFMIGALGIEASAEGPFKKGKQSSYLINYRYSTLTLLKGFLDLGNVAPDYQDLSFKLNFPTKKTGTFSLFGIAGLNKANRDIEKDSTKWNEDNENENYTSKGKLGIIGLSHQFFLNKKSYIKTIISATGDEYNETSDTLNPKNNYTRVETVKTKFINKALRGTVVYNNKLNSNHTVRGGIIISNLGFNYNNEYYDETDAVWKQFVKGKGNTMFYQAYAQWKWRINNKWTLNSGLQTSLFALNNSKSIEPRASIAYQIKPGQSLAFSAGMHSKPEHLSTYYFQNIETNKELTTANKNLDLTRAAHFVLAYDKSFGGGIRLKTEAYYQHLYKVPVEKDAESFFSVINAGDIYSFFGVDSALMSTGKGKNYGVDISLEKSFSKNYYFLLTTSLYQSKYTTYSGKEYNTRYNRNYQLNIVAGKEWKLGERKIFGLNGKVLINGSLRDSPIDLEKSKLEKEAVYVKDKYYTLKGDPYYRFDIGLSYKVNRKRATHSIMFDLQNITNHENLFYSYYDNDRQKLRKVYQMGIFPIISYRVEF